MKKYIRLPRYDKDPRPWSISWEIYPVSLGRKTHSREVQSLKNKLILFFLFKTFTKKMITTINVCNVCGKTGEDVKWCGRCKTTKYCSRACQASSWSAHKKVCKRLDAKEQCGMREFFSNKIFIHIIRNLYGFWNDGKMNSILVYIERRHPGDPCYVETDIVKQYLCVFTKQTMTEGYIPGCLNVELFLKIDRRSKPQVVGEDEFLGLKSALKFSTEPIYEPEFCQAECGFKCLAANSTEDSSLSTCYYTLGDTLFMM